MAELYEHFDTDTNHLGCLTKLKQSSTVEDFIVAFEQLNFRIEGMPNVFFPRMLYQWPQGRDTCPRPHGSLLKLGGRY